MLSNLQQYVPEANISIHKDIRFHPDLTSGEKMFYAEICAISKKNGSCPFSSRKLSQFFSVSHQTIQNWVKKLVNLELLEVGIDLNNQECRQYIKMTEKSKKNS